MHQKSILTVEPLIEFENTFFGSGNKENIPFFEAIIRCYKIDNDIATLNGNDIQAKAFSEVDISDT